jgi:hypothetical protein
MLCWKLRAFTVPFTFLGGIFWLLILIVILILLLIFIRMVTIQHLSRFFAQSRLKPAFRGAGFSRLCAPVVRQASRPRAGAGMLHVRCR